MKQGELFIITTGAYSDYGISGKFKAEKDFDFDAVLKAWLEAHPDEQKEYSFSSHKFLEHLESEGFVSVAHILTLHLSDYACVANAPEKSARARRDSDPPWV